MTLILTFAFDAQKRHVFRYHRRWDDDVVDVVSSSYSDSSFCFINGNTRVLQLVFASPSLVQKTKKKLFETMRFDYSTAAEQKQTREILM